MNDDSLDHTPRRRMPLPTSRCGVLCDGSVTKVRETSTFTVRRN